MNTYELIIDEYACWGCMACEVACKQELNPRDGIRLIKVTEQWSHGAEGSLNLTFHVAVCRHCDDPPCAEVCPEEAIAKRDDGIVIINHEECSGCKACIEACPYGAIDFDADQGIAQKCDLCYHRVDHGLLPACADNVCPAHCIYFGDPEEMGHRISSGAELTRLRQDAPSGSAGSFT